MVSPCAYRVADPHQELVSRAQPPLPKGELARCNAVADEGAHLNASPLLSAWCIAHCKMHKMMKQYETIIRDSFRLKRAWFITEAVNLQKESAN